jgi:hypothetical protein
LLLRGVGFFLPLAFASGALAVALLLPSLVSGGLCKANKALVLSVGYSYNAGFGVGYKLAAVGVGETYNHPALRLWLWHYRSPYRNQITSSAWRDGGALCASSGFALRKTVSRRPLSEHESTVKARRVSALLCGQTVVKM